MMVLSLCATVRTVQSLKQCLIVCWMSSSVSRSTAAVASSSMSTLVRRIRERVMQMSCLWPTLVGGGREQVGQEYYTTN